jgi:hypothetical protein
VLGAATSKIDGFLLGESRVSYNQLIRHVWKRESLSHLETPMLQEVFLEKLTQLSLGNNVLVALATKIYHFLYRDACVFSTL